MKAKNNKNESLKKNNISKKLNTLGKNMVYQIREGISPSFITTVRSRSNIHYDKDEGYLKLGDKKEKRTFINISQTKKFMQTMAVAAKCKKYVDEKLHTSIRGLYYQLKFSLGEDLEEDLFTEQSESTPLIEDLEVALNVKREDFNLSTDRKGFVVGNLTIEDGFGGDKTIIDCSKQGRSGWSIPSDVDNNMKLVNVDADYVLVVEKDALWQRLNEDKFWKKNNCILITPKGQASRGCRRLLRKLADNNLPVYVFSVDASEPVVLIDRDGMIKNEMIGPYVDRMLKKNGKIKTPIFEKTVVTNYQALEVDAKGNTKTGAVLNVLRHPIKKKLTEITAECGFSVKTTKSHSIMVFENYKIVPKAVSEVKKGDLLVVPLNVPNNESVTEISIINLLLKECPNLAEKIQVVGSGLGKRRKRMCTKSLKDFNKLQLSKLKDVVLRYGKSKIQIKNKIKLTKRFARLLGYFVAKGSSTSAMELSFGSHEKKYIDDVQKIVKNTLGVDCTVSHPHKSETQLKAGGKLVGLLFERILSCGKGAANKRIPPIIFNAPKEIKYEFLRGYFRGDGGVWTTKKGIRLWASTISRGLSADLILLLLQLNCWATVEKKRGKPNSNEKEKYHILIYNRVSLKKLKSIAIDLNPNIGKLIDKNILKSPVYKSIPTKLLKPLQIEIYQFTKKGISDIFSQKTVSFRKLERLLPKEFRFILSRDKIFSFTYANPWKTTAEISQEVNIPFITVFKSLKRAEKKGFVDSKLKKRKRIWKMKINPKIKKEKIKQLKLLLNLAKNNVALIPVKQIKNVDSSNGFVYDIEVAPTHTFVGGMGPLLLHNTDCDAWGWYIYWTIKTGSMNLAYLGKNIAVPEAKYIGVTMKDIKTYDFLSKMTIKAKDIDIKRAKEMISYPWISKHKEWIDELDTVIKTKKKLEQDALQGPRLTFVNDYLIEKISKRIFLP